MLRLFLTALDWILEARRRRRARRAKRAGDDINRTTLRILRMRPRRRP
jgi:hypothetical protein